MAAAFGRRSLDWTRIKDNAVRAKVQVAAIVKL
jgi:hypothetical protein